MNEVSQKSNFDPLISPEGQASQAVIPLAEDDCAPTAPIAGSYGWADDFLSQAPFVEINVKRLISVCEGATRLTGSSAIAAHLLLSLPRSCGLYSEDDAAPIIARLKAGDYAVLADEPHFFDQPGIADSLAGLFAFARSGEGPGRSPEEARTGIRRLLEHNRALVASIPEAERREMPEGFPWLVHTLAAADARWAMDNGLPVLPEGLAALGGVKPKTIANLIAAKTVPVDADGLIPAAAALVWLGSRKDFVPSQWQTWQEEPPTSGLASVEPTLSAQVFVPVDSNGHPFLPSLARRSKGGTLRYIIGEKSTPEYVEDYWDSLDKLARMPTPRWRRPNPAKQGDGWGLVSAQEGWRRYSRADLERMVEAVQRGEEH